MAVGPVPVNRQVARAERGRGNAGPPGSAWRIESKVVGPFRRGIRYFTMFHAKIGQPMRILMIAPEPFFEPRGTPFSEFHRIKALTTLGHQVDLVTCPFGEDVVMPGLRVFRSLRPPFVTRVKIGPSLAKIPLDFLLTFAVIRRAFATK